MAKKSAHQGGIPTELQAAENAPVAIDELVPAVEIYKTVFIDNRLRVDRAVSYGQTIQVLPDQKVLTAEQDAKALQFLQKCALTMDGEKEGVAGAEPKKGVKEQRLASTRILDKAKAWAMLPEKELQAEMDRIKALRDARATHVAAEAAAAQKKIDDAKAYETYRNHIKAEMQAGYQLKVAEKIDQLRVVIKGMFDAATLETVGKLAGQLNITPGLKPEGFKEMLTVPYDSSKMTAEQFAELRDKAYAYFSFEKVNESYIKLAKDTIQGWRDKIDAKRAELEAVAKGGAEAEKAKAAAAATAAQEEADLKIEKENAALEIQQTAAATLMQDNLQTEFNAQMQIQKVEESVGAGKEIKVFRFAPSVEVDPYAFSKAISSVILNVMMNTDQGGKTNKDVIFKKGANSNDEHGQRLYIEPIQWWLDQLAKVAYANNSTIPGVVMEKKVSTTTRG